MTVEAENTYLAVRRAAVTIHSMVPSELQKSEEIHQSEREEQLLEKKKLQTPLHTTQRIFAGTNRATSPLIAAGLSK